MVKQYLENTRFPFNLTDRVSFKNEIEKSTIASTEFVEQFENILRLRSTLKLDFDVDFIPTDVLEYAGFLFSNLTETMPSYNDIEEIKIKEVLVMNHVPNPSPKHVNWALENWLLVIASSQQIVILDYLRGYFKSNQNDFFINELLEVIEKYLFREVVSEDLDILYFIKNIAPIQAKILLSRLKGKSKSLNEEIEEVLEELYNAEY